MNSRFFSNVFITGFLAVQVFLSVRCYFIPQKFFGWQMFSDPILYRDKFYGVTSEGERKPLSIEDYRPLFRGKFPGIYSLPAGRYRTFNRGRKFLIKKLSLYPEFLCRKLKDKGYQAMEVTLEHRAPSEKETSKEIFRSDCVSGEGI